MEDCEAHRFDGNDLSKHPGYAWLVKINTTNTHSLRNIHLHIRTERIYSSHTPDLFFTLAKLAPNLTRLAIVPEAHRPCDASFRALNPYRRRHHNRVVSLDPPALRELTRDLELFKRLKMVQIGGSQEAVGMDRLFAALGGHVRVQGIEGSFAWRGTFGVSGKLWEGVDAAMKWYDVAPGTVLGGMEKLKLGASEGKEKKVEEKKNEGGKQDGKMKRQDKKSKAKKK